MIRGFCFLLALGQPPMILWFLSLWLHSWNPSLLGALVPWALWHLGAGPDLWRELAGA